MLVDVEHVAHAPRPASVREGGEQATTTETVIVPAEPGFELVITEWRAESSAHKIIDRVPVVAWARSR